MKTQTLYCKRSVIGFCEQTKPLFKDKAHVLENLFLAFKFDDHFFLVGFGRRCHCCWYDMYLHRLLLDRDIIILLLLACQLPLLACLDYTVLLVLLVLEHWHLKGPILQLIIKSTLMQLLFTFIDRQDKPRSGSQFIDSVECDKTPYISFQVWRILKPTGSTGHFN